MWNSGRFASMVATVSPREMPSLASPPATASTRASSSDQVSETLSSGQRTATMSGWLTAVRRSASVNVGASTALPAAAGVVLVAMSLLGPVLVEPANVRETLPQQGGLAAPLG